MSETTHLLHTHVVHEESYFSRIKKHSREAAAEMLGTAVLVIFGCGSIASTVLSGGANGGWVSINLGFGLGLTAGIYVAGGISGAHLNPAVSLTLAIYRGFSWAKLPLYWFAQTLGAFLGALVIYVNYLPALNNSKFGGFDNVTAGIFATYPQPYVGAVGAFISEFIGTFMLLLIILATGDKNNFPAGPSTPIVLGLTLLVIGASLGLQTGYALNPARDFGPRLLTAIAGWGFKVFTRQGFYTWIPLIAPLGGGVFAGLVYDGLIYRREH